MSGRRGRVYRATPGELQARRIQNAAPVSSHSAGWPHFDQAGNCLCVERCCFGPRGCQCPSCRHQSHPAYCEHGVAVGSPWCLDCMRRDIERVPADLAGVKA